METVTKKWGELKAEGAAGANAGKVVRRRSARGGELREYYFSVCFRVLRLRQVFDGARLLIHMLYIRSSEKLLKSYAIM